MADAPTLKSSYLGNDFDHAVDFLMVFSEALAFKPNLPDLLEQTKRTHSLLADSSVLPTSEQTYNYAFVFDYLYNTVLPRSRPRVLNPAFWQDLCETHMRRHKKLPPSMATPKGLFDTLERLCWESRDVQDSPSAFKPISVKRVPFNGACLPYVGEPALIAQDHCLLPTPAEREKWEKQNLCIEPVAAQTVWADGANPATEKRPEWKGSAVASIKGKTL